MVSKSPSDSLSKRLNGLQMGVTNHLLASMILQVFSPWLCRFVFV